MSGRRQLVELPKGRARRTPRPPELAPKSVPTPTSPSFRRVRPPDDGWKKTAGDFPRRGSNPRTLDDWKSEAERLLGAVADSSLTFHEAEHFFWWLTINAEATLAAYNAVRVKETGSAP